MTSLHSPAVRVYRTPNVLPFQKEAQPRSFNGSSIICDYKSLGEYKKIEAERQLQLIERKKQ